MTFLILTIVTVLLLQAVTINRKVNTYMATQAEHAARLKLIGDQLAKAQDEILKAIADLKEAVANAGATSPEVDAAADALTAAAQSLDDIHPDAPAPEQPV